MPLGSPAAVLLRRFAGKNVLVIGGASGIGAAVVRRLTEEGGTVYVADLPIQSPHVPPERFFPVDVTDEAAVVAMAETCDERAGDISVLVNCAGVTALAPVQSTDFATWTRVLGVNLTGLFLATREFQGRMHVRRSGVIVNISSDAGLVGQRDQAAYCASKGGVVQLTRAAALDGAPFGVRVNCVCPCFVDTPLMRDWIIRQPDPRAAERAIAAEQPIGRFGQPEEVAAAAAFLASDEATFITGVALPVDGGVTAQ
jgi:2-keto-3-deoxy-L-fuconate dehydrogenase